MRRSFPIALISLWIMAGCGSDTQGNNLTGTPDAGQRPDATANPGPADAGPDVMAFVPAPHPAFPQLVNSGGPILANPKVVGVFFSDYTHTDQVAAMLDGLPNVQVASGWSFWSDAVGEYGVGPLTVLPPIKVAEAGPTSILTNPASWLTAKLNSNDPAFAAVDANTVVTIFYPATTPLLGSCAGGGNGYGGFHESLTAARGQIPYAVVAECASFGPITSALDMVTVAGSHEVIEAVTDPNPTSTPAYATIDASGWAMHVLLSGNEENGDMCTINNGYVRPAAPYGYLISRGWSNRAAQAGNVDPCAPDLRPAQPFVGAYPVMPDTVSVLGVTGTGPGVKIPVGTSKTIDVACFSFAPTAPFTVVAREAGAPNPPNLTFAFDRATCVNGETLHLTITANSAGFGSHAFALRAKLPAVADLQTPTWAGVVQH